MARAVTICIAAVLGVTWAWADSVTGGWVTGAILGGAALVWLYRTLMLFLAALLVR